MLGNSKTAFLGAGQAYRQIPHPVQAEALMVGRPWSSVMAPGTGHCSKHTVQKERCHARQSMVSILAVPILTGAWALKASAAQAWMQGVSAHCRQGALAASITGVPAAARSRAGAATMAS